jgi:vacuolar-type H+-ATPase subunit H
VPAVYARDFDKVHTSGTIGVDGRVKGEYGDGAFPSFAVNAKVNDAAFKYDDLPLAARSISMDLSLTNPGGSADNTVVNLDRFRLVVGNNPIEARMSMRTPVSDPDVDARVAGRLDLADLRRTVKLEGVDELSGTLVTNAAVRTRMSAVQKKQYDKVGASGTLDIANLTLKGKALPHPLAIQKASLALAPQHAKLESFTGTIGSSDIQASGTLDNLLAFALRGDTLQGTATVRSNHFDLNEWKSDDSELEIIPVPPKLDLTLDATVKSLSYDNLTMSDAHGRVRVKNQRATLEGFQVATLGGQIGVDGFYETTHPDKPTFDVALKLTKVDIPSAFKALVTVQTLAPAARYAAGNVTTDMRINGALGKNMLPLFASLSGGGTMETSQLAVHDFPVMNKIAEKTKLAFLNDPTLQPLKAAFDIRDGRLFVKPFDARLGGATMKVSGSNGLDQSLAYTLDLHVPRALAGGAANQAFDGLVQQAGKARVDLANAPEIPFAIKVSGSVTKPQVTADVGSAAAAAATTVTNAVQKAADERVSAAKEKASAEATRIVQEAEQQAASIKQDARVLADTVKAKAYRQADSLVARAGNPLLKVAAKPAGDKLRKEADDKAAKIVREADQRADSLVSAARERASKIAPMK